MLKALLAGRAIQHVLQQSIISEMQEEYGSPTEESTSDLLLASSRLRPNYKLISGVENFLWDV